MLDVLDCTDQVESVVSSYQNFPSNKPFINTDWTRSQPTNLSKAYPASNRDEIISSLKKLQEKLLRLEMEQKSEQQQIPNNLVDNVYLAYPINNGYQVTNCCFYDDKNKTIQSSNNISLNENLSYMKQLVNIDEKAISTEKRVLELEKQLERMRKLIRDDSESVHISNNHFKEITKKNHLIDNTIIESDTTLHDVDQVFSSNEENNSLKNKQTKSKQKRPVKLKQESYTNNNLKIKCNLNRSRSADDNQIPLHRSHFKLNLGDIPFVVGKSTTPSHHLGTNIQNVFSLLKQHHPKLCGKFSNSCKSSDSNATSTSITTSNRYQFRANTRCSTQYQLDNHLIDESKIKRSKSTPHTNIVKSQEKSSELICSNKKKKKLEDSVKNVDKINRVNHSCSDDNLMNNVDWNELLRILQEEYTKLVLHHYDLTKKIINCIDENKRSEYELKAEYLHKKMKTKAKQINKLKSIQQLKTSSYTSTSSINNNLYKRTGIENQMQNQHQSNLLTTSQINNLNGSPNKYNYLRTQLSMLNNNNNSNSISVSSSIDKQSMNPKTLKLFKDIKSFQNSFQKK